MLTAPPCCLRLSLVAPGVWHEQRARVAAAASAAAGAAAVGGATVLCDDAVHTVKYEWPHSGLLQTFDHAA